MTIYDAGLISGDNVSRKTINRFGRGAGGGRGGGCTPFLKREKEVSKLFLECMRSYRKGEGSALCA